MVCGLGFAAVVKPNRDAYHGSLIFMDVRMSRFAMLFPGQGSQAVGMLGDLAQKNAIINETLEEAGAGPHWCGKDQVNNSTAPNEPSQQYWPQALPCGGYGSIAKGVTQR